MILLDSETTSLTSYRAIDDMMDAHIIEFAALKLDDETMEELDRLHFMCKPPIPLDKETIKITGIKDEELKNEKPFAAHYLELVRFFVGQTIMVAHNLPFDRRCLELELSRLDLVTHFPWPWHHVCTAEITADLNKGKYFKQEELYEYVTKQPANQTHRAMDDVEQLRTIVLWLRKQSRL